MPFSRIKSHAKLNLALNVISKSKSLHNIESIISFVDLHDIILIKKIKSKKHLISFNGKFSRRIGKKNTVSKLFEILEKKKILKNQRFQIKIKKSIPDKAGLGGGSMNAASILRYLAHKRIINIKNKEMLKISKLIGSDVMLGLNHKSKILNSRNKIKYFNAFNEDPTHLSLLSYDLVGLVYYLSMNANAENLNKIFKRKNSFKGKIGIFEINKNKISHILNFYVAEDNNFKKFSNLFKSF